MHLTDGSRKMDSFRAGKRHTVDRGRSVHGQSSNFARGRQQPTFGLAVTAESAIRHRQR